MRLRSGHIIEDPRSDYSMTMNVIANTSNTFSGLAYPHHTLTKIVGKPTPVSLKLLKRELYANARAIPCLHDANTYGHLGVIMPDAAYRALGNATRYTAPVAPILPTIANGTDGVAITNRMETYRQNLAKFQTHNQVENDLKQMIIAAVEPMYIASLEDSIMGFATQTANTILTHLMDTYGVIKQSDIEKNRNRLSEPWTPDQPIETLWQRVKDVNDFATIAQEVIPASVQIRLVKDEDIEHVRFKLRMFGVPISESQPATYIYCDNDSVVKNSSRVDSTLNKKHSEVAYHFTRWNVTARVCTIGWVETDYNIADAFTKRLAEKVRDFLFGEWTY